MHDRYFAIATDNELEAMDLSDIITSRRGIHSQRVEMTDAAARPEGMDANTLPIALFLGLTRKDPRYAWMRDWAVSHNVRIIFMDGNRDPHSRDLTLARPFTTDDVARVLDVI